jgi:hypothetical protein
MPAEFTPVIYLKNGCPFCFKLRVALLELGLLNKLNIRQFSAGTPQEKSIKDELSSKFEKVSFPAAEIAPGVFKSDSDDLIAHFATLEGVDPKDLPTLQAYKDGPFSELMRLFKENRQLKKSQAS